MQKKIIALAVAGLVSGGAFAQASNVQVYGIMDVGYQYIDMKDNKCAGAVAAVPGCAAGQNSVASKQGILGQGDVGSRLGFRGTEDLGNGLKAIFQNEFYLFPETGSSLGGGISRTRNAWLGLSGDKWGSVIAGRLQTPWWDFAGGAYLRPLGGVANSTGFLQSIYGMSGDADRVDSALQYTSPNMSGLTLKALYTWDIATNDTPKDVNYTGDNATGGQQPAWILGADYKNGPFAMNVVYKNVRDSNGLLTTVPDNGKKEYGIGANWDFKVVKVGSGYQKQSLNSDDASVANDAKNKFKNAYLWTLWADAPVMGDKLHLIGQYAKSHSDVNDSAGNAWALGGRYYLSKRSWLYATYSKANLDDGVSSNGFWGSGTPAGAAAGNSAGTNNFAEPGTSVSSWFAGMVHTF